MLHGPSDQGTDSPGCALNPGEAAASACQPCQHHTFTERTAVDSGLGSIARYPCILSSVLQNVAKQFDLQKQQPERHIAQEQGGTNQLDFIALQARLLLQEMQQQPEGRQGDEQHPQAKEGSPCPGDSAAAAVGASPKTSCATASLCGGQHSSKRAMLLEKVVQDIQVLASEFSEQQLTAIAATALAASRLKQAALASNKGDAAAAQAAQARARSSLLSAVSAAAAAAASSKTSTMAEASAATSVQLGPREAAGRREQTTSSAFAPLAAAAFPSGLPPPAAGAGKSAMDGRPASSALESALSTLCAAGSAAPAEKTSAKDTSKPRNDAHPEPGAAPDAAAGAAPTAPGHPAALAAAGIPVTPQLPVLLPHSASVPRPPGSATAHTAAAGTAAAAGHSFLTSKTSDSAFGGREAWEKELISNMAEMERSDTVLSHVSADSAAATGFRRRQGRLPLAFRSRGQVAANPVGLSAPKGARKSSSSSSHLGGSEGTLTTAAADATAAALLTGAFGQDCIEKVGSNTDQLLRLVSACLEVGEFAAKAPHGPGTSSSMAPAGSAGLAVAGGTASGSGPLGALSPRSFSGTTADHLQVSRRGTPGVRLAHALTGALVPGGIANSAAATIATLPAGRNALVAPEVPLQGRSSERGTAPHCRSAKRDREDCPGGEASSWQQHLLGMLAAGGLGVPKRLRS